MTLECKINHQQGDFTLDITASSEGLVTALWGVSGAGKTTLVRAIAGLLRPKHARISVAGRVLCDTDNGVFLPPHRRGIGYIFQDVRLFPHMSVRQNLMFGASRGGADKALFDRVVDILGIEVLLGRRPAQLSGGERQRVGIGRALISGPQLLIADEPLSSLDASRRQEILPYFQKVIHEFHVPMIYVSHSLLELGWLAQDVWALEAGRLVANGNIKDVFSNASALAMAQDPQFSTVLLTYLGQDHDGLWMVGSQKDRLYLTQAPQSQIGGLCPVRIGASDVIVSTKKQEGLSALNCIAAKVVAITPQSAHHVTLTLQSSLGQFQALITSRSKLALELEVGQPISAIIKTLALCDDL